MTHKYLVTTLLLLLSLGTSGCSRQTTVEQSPSPDKPVKLRAEIKRLPKAVLPDGWKLTLELAVTQEETAQGLMFRPRLAPDRGMLFIFEQERIPSFWMKNTLIPLDIVFLDPAGRVVDISADARPCQGEPCPQYRPRTPALAVLEINSGAAASHGVVPGAVIRFRRVPGYPKMPIDDTRDPQKDGKQGLQVDTGTEKTQVHVE